MNVRLLVIVLGIVLGCGARTPLPTGDLGPTGALVGLRLIAPLSTSTVTSQRPTLRWILGAEYDGAEIDLCPTRACDAGVTTFRAPGTAATPPSTLSAGLYYWRARSMHGGTVGTTSSPTWQFWVGARSAPVDTSWGTTLDVNGDGIPELVVSDSTSSYLYLGSRNGFPAQPSQTFTPSDFATSAGDLNGDGYGDLVVSTGDSDLHAVIAYVYLGGPAGLLSPPTAIRNHNRYSAASGAVAAAGDMNGDGFADLLIGDNDGNGFEVPETTLGYVYFGSAGGISEDARTILRGPESPQNTGPVVASMGDLNGDGFGDVLIAADNGGASNFTAGNAFLFFGGAGGPSSTHVALVASDQGQPLDSSGVPPTAGDFDGDGYADVVVSDVDGTALVYRGGRDGVSSTPSLTVTCSVDENFAWGAALSAGDINGDGFSDLLVGSPSEGVVFLYPGSATGLPSLPSQMLVGPDGTDAFTGFAAALAVVGDVNRDGFADVVIGAWRAFDALGAAYVYLGGPSGLGTAPDTMFVSVDQNTADVPAFGSAVATLIERVVRQAEPG